MSAGDALSPGQFHHVYEGSEFSNAGGGTFHQVSAFHGEKQIGRMAWVTVPNDPQYSNEIRNIQVEPGYRRQGVASGMYAAGRAFADIHQIDPPRHSRDRTDQGDAWAKKVSPKKSVPKRID